MGTEAAVLRPAQGIQFRVSRFAVFVAVVGLLYVLGAETTFWIEHEAATGVAFFPAAGVSLAALAVTPTHRWPWVLGAIALAEASVDLQHGQALWMALGFAVANIAEPYVGATLLRRTHRNGARLRPYFTRYVVYAVIVGPVVGATIGTAVASFAGLSDPNAWIAVKWWIGDALGVLVIATCALAWIEQRRHHVDPTVAWPEVVAFPVAAAALTFVILVFWHQPLIYIVLPVLMWSALRGGFSLVTTAGVAMALVAEVVVGSGQTRDALVADVAPST
ncbi:MAG: MASE1 domain-containing protein, partial [Actinobacteria bacterium]|nr:MASE1 domain-containing protein [Actinomycetota bacterium]